MKLAERIRNDLSLPFFGVVGLWLLYTGLFAYLQEDLPPLADLFYTTATWVGVSWWLIEDARRHRFTLPMSYGLMFIFLSPIIFPIYILQTRKWMGFVTLGLYFLV